LKHLVAIVGPTGTGKSQLAIRLAQKFHGEIVNADSRQIYRYLDIGTATPGIKDTSLVPHHLLNIINPDDDFSLSQYQELAYQHIEDILQRGRLPFLAGGSGQYVWSVLEGWKIPQVPPDPEFRQRLEKKAAIDGAGQLYQELLSVDPEAARYVDRRNVRRVIRALEVHAKTSIPFSRMRHREAPPFISFIVGLTTDRAELYHRLDQRVEDMMAQGLVAEVEKLANMGYDFNLPAMSSISYRQIGQYLRGELSLAAAVQQIKLETHRYVRRQYNWFSLKDDRIHWFDLRSDPDTEIETALTEALNSENID